MGYCCLITGLAQRSLREGTLRLRGVSGRLVRERASYDFRSCRLSFVCRSEEPKQYRELGALRLIHGVTQGHWCASATCNARTPPLAKFRFARPPCFSAKLKHHIRTILPFLTLASFLHTLSREHSQGTGVIPALSRDWARTLLVDLIEKSRQ